MLAKMTFQPQPTSDSQRKPSRFSFDAIKKNPAVHEFQRKVEKSAKEFKLLVEKLWLHD